MLRSATAALALSVVLAPAALAGPARVSFTRTIPPPHDLSWAERVAVVYAIGDNDKVTSFVEHFAQYAARGGTLRVENAVENNQYLGSFSEKSLSALRRKHPADAYIGVSLFTCAEDEGSGEAGETDITGRRVRRRVQWLDVVCSARLDVRKPDGKRMLTFMTHGEGTSPRVSALSDDDRDIAFEQAARFAALNAAESITPRMLRESIELDGRAPAFDEALPMLDADQLSDVRAIWERALVRHRHSAALHYNLGAVCEALGDVRAAEEYFRAALRLEPGDVRSKTELGLLRKRNPPPPK